MDNPYGWLQSFIDQVPDILQPLIVALAGAIPYVEGEGASAFGIIAGIHPVIAAIAAMTGNILCVIGVVALGSRIRERAVARRAAKTETARRSGVPVTPPLGESSDGTAHATAMSETTSMTVIDERDADAEPDADPDAKPTRRSKGRAKIRHWMVRFGVPGASLLAPLALPTMLTAAFFVGSGVPKQWVILWQVVAVVLWTTATALAATGAIALLGW